MSYRALVSSLVLLSFLVTFNGKLVVCSDKREYGASFTRLINCNTEHGSLGDYLLKHFYSKNFSINRATNFIEIKEKEK